MNSFPALDDEALLKMMDDDIGILVLVQGTLTDGSSHYAYASIPPSRYVAFKEAEAKGEYDLAHFGTILMHGAGKYPPADMQKKMKEEYGANHRFEDELEQWMENVKKLQVANNNFSTE